MNNYLRAAVEYMEFVQVLRQNRAAGASEVALLLQR